MSDSVDSSLLSQEEKLRLRREARRQKILATGGDRLARITGSYSNLSSVNNESVVKSDEKTVDLSLDNIDGSDSISKSTTAHNTTLSSQDKSNRLNEFLNNQKSKVTENKEESEFFKKPSTTIKSEKQKQTGSSSLSSTLPSESSSDSTPSHSSVGKNTMKGENQPTPTTQLRQRAFNKIPQSPSVARTPQKQVTNPITSFEMNNNPHDLAESFLKAGSIPQNMDHSTDQNLENTTVSNVQSHGGIWRWAHMFTMFCIALLAIYAVFTSDHSFDSDTDDGTFDINYIMEDDEDQILDLKLLNLSSYIPSFMIPFLRKLKLMKYKSVDFNLDTLFFGFPVSIWMIFLTVECIITCMRFYVQKSQPSSLIPEEMKSMMAAAGLPSQSLNNWASILETSNNYRNILTGLFHDVLILVFVFGGCIMIADLVI